MSNRVEKANSVLKREIANIIQNDLSDPRLSGQMVSVTGVSLSPDLSYAKVFVSIFGEKDANETLQAVKSAGGFIRRELASKVKFRTLPELNFLLDTSGEYSQKINGILSGLDFSQKEYNDQNYFDNDHNNKH